MSVSNKHQRICAKCGRQFMAPNKVMRYCSRECNPIPKVWRNHRSPYVGYVVVYDPSHLNANSAGYVREHIAIAAVALGKPIPKGVVVHHVNGDGADNRNSNLVICESSGYHQLLHYRMGQIAEGIDPDQEKRCNDCKQVKPLAAFLHPRGSHVGDKRCHECALRFFRERNHRNFQNHPEWWSRKKGIN